MPMDTHHSFDVENYAFNHRRIGKQRLRSWVPRRCFLSNKPLWFKKCVVVVTMLTGPGDTIFQNYWCDEKEFFLNEFKGKK